MTSENKLNSSGRIYYLDVMRAAACLGVIMIHTVASFCKKDFGSFDFWASNILDVLGQMGVPCFVMISGALMLDENYAYSSKKLFGHIKKLILFFIFWTLLYFVLFRIIDPFDSYKDLSLKESILEIIKGPYHLWYIYMIIGLYLIVPLLRLWVKKENVRQIRYFLVLSFIFTFFLPQLLKTLTWYHPVFKNISEILDTVDLKYAAGYTSYFILGWYLNNFEIKRKKLMITLGCLGFVSSIVLTYVFSVSFEKSVIYYENLYVNILFYSIMVFVLIMNKYKNTKESDTLKCKTVKLISKYSLGIYGGHVAILRLMIKLLQNAGITGVIPTVLLAYIPALVLPLLLSVLLKKIPILKNAA